MDSDNRIQDVDVNSSTEVGQTEQKENEIRAFVEVTNRNHVTEQSRDVEHAEGQDRAVL